MCSRTPGMLSSVGLGFGFSRECSSGIRLEQGREWGALGYFGMGNEEEVGSQLQSFSPSGGPTDVLFSSPGFLQGHLRPPQPGS